MQHKLIYTGLIIVVAALAVGVTSAYFSDAETSTGNVLAAGTLDLNLDGDNINVVKFNLNNLKPGDSGSGSWILKNVGNLDGYVDVESISQINNDNNCNEPESAVDETCTATGGGELNANLEIRLFVDQNTNNIWDAETDTNIYNGLASNLAASYDLNWALTASSTASVVLNWQILTSTDNVIQSDSLELGLAFELGQTAEQ